ncbi:MAG: GTP-binding protein, partial [Metallosphaera sp.]
MGGDEIAISKVLTNIEYDTKNGLEYLSVLSKFSGKAHTIGITGIPGAGKSTLISALIENYVKAGHKVGVIMIDPSSPISMGSFMGNRIRMQEKSLMNNVFIRSIASRGHLGGFTSEAIMLTEALDGLGYDRIILETVGAGQTDTDVMSASHTLAVLVIPGAGDEIQAFKAGIMEIGDVYVINKADKPEAEAV